MTHKINDAIPLAYFITFTCYGCWLHGGKPEGTVNRYRNIPQTPFLPFNKLQKITNLNRMRYSTYKLDSVRRPIVLDTIKAECEFREWSLLAAHVRSTHVHVVVNSLNPPEFIMNTFKTYASRNLNKLKLDNTDCKRWTRHGSTRYLWNIEEIEATIQYVVYEQGNPMSVYENKERIIKNPAAF